ncbi:hypothetical protein SprV_0200773300 [Sparganum proliferum]
MDSQLINHLWMNFHSRASTTTVHKLLFTDDCALNATSEGSMLRRMDLFAAACDNFGHIINTEKTVVTHQPSSDTAYDAPQINMNGAQLKVVDYLTYLGITLSHNTKVGDELARRISKASLSFSHLQDTIWNRHGLSISTRLKMYKAVILPTLLYEAETWTACKEQARKLNHFHLGCLQLNRWQDWVPNTDVLERTGIPSIHVMLRQ